MTIVHDPKGSAIAIGNSGLFDKGFDSNILRNVVVKRHHMLKDLNTTLQRTCLKLMFTSPRFFNDVEKKTCYDENCSKALFPSILIEINELKCVPVLYNRFVDKLVSSIFKDLDLVFFKMLKKRKLLLRRNLFFKC